MALESCFMMIDLFESLSNWMGNMHELMCICVIQSGSLKSDVSIAKVAS